MFAKCYIMASAFHLNVILYNIVFVSGFVSDSVIIHLVINIKMGRFNLRIKLQKEALPLKEKNKAYCKVTVTEMNLQFSILRKNLVNGF